MDVMMPKVDGYDATLSIRGIAGNIWVPIIFLSAKVTPADQIKGIEVGGDDYLIKPVNLELLEAKLNAMIRIVDMQKELARTHSSLQRYYDQAEQELELAKSLMQNMTEYSSDYIDDSVHVYSNALEDINGDIAITYRSSKDNNLYALLADATGHGLSAAISQIPLTQTFYQMAEKGYSVSAIVREMNNTLKKLLPADRFVTATIALINPESRFMEVWNGSNPSPIFVDKDGNILKEFSETNFALGIVNNEVLDSTTDVFVWPEDGELILYSDGIVDLKNEAGELFGLNGIRRAASLLKDKERKNQIAFDVVIGFANNFCRNGERSDDLSLISIECN
jgi:serine phosphatase RsbU (regulator of sigma subunit)